MNRICLQLRAFQLFHSCSSLAWSVGNPITFAAALFSQWCTQVNFERGVKSRVRPTNQVLCWGMRGRTEGTVQLCSRGTGWSTVCALTEMGQEMGGDGQSSGLCQISVDRFMPQNRAMANHLSRIQGTPNGLSVSRTRSVDLSPLVRWAALARTHSCKQELQATLQHPGRDQSSSHVLPPLRCVWNLQVVCWTGRRRVGIRGAQSIRRTLVC